MQHGPAMHAKSFSKKRASYEMVLKSTRQIAEGTRAFVFEKPAGFHFTAGQHVRLTLLDPAETDAKGNSRFLTLASTPQDPELMFAMRMSDSAFKRTLGSTPADTKVLIEMLLESPHGSFALHTDTSRPAVFLAGGIGIVPAYSMIKDWTERQLSHKVILFYANRRPEDAPFLAELQTLAAQNPDFTLIATVTEPEKSSVAWTGETGYIDQVMLKKYVTDLQTPLYYLAGLSAMVSAMQTLLAQCGIRPQSIRAEQFDGFDLNTLTPAVRPRRNYRVVTFSALAFAVVAAAHLTPAISILKAIHGN